MKTLAAGPIAGIGSFRSMSIRPYFVCGCAEEIRGSFSMKSITFSPNNRQV